ncbi:MAG: PBP1A family penicillin-binding protein [Halanaerobacter sp.]
MINWKQKFSQLAIISIILIFAIGLGSAIGVITWVISESPDISDYGQWKTSESTVIYASNGDPLTKLYKENRVYASLDQIPKHLQNAVISIEDERFRSHHGLDFKGIIRAIWVDLKHMAKVEGASTITQQLAKNVLLTHEKLFSRKFQEMYIALQFERMYTKNEILEFYLNEIFLGHSAYGVQSAAKSYFNKDVEELTIAESALIAALIKAPNGYSPYRNKDAAKARRDLVLTKMAEQGHITKEEAQKAKEESINLERPTKDNKKLAPYFITHIRKKLIDKFGSQRAYTGGLEVHTTLDVKMQKKANESIKTALQEGHIPTTSKQAGKGDKQPQLSLVTVDPNNGHIKAMVGGRGDDKFNRVTQAYRQPGSAFKPFVYTTAVEQGMGTGSIIDDSLKEYKTKFKDDAWIPKNYNGKYLGPTTLRMGLAKSINVMAVKLLDEIGIPETIDTAQNLGISSLTQNDKNLPLALGGITRGVTPLQMTQAYSVFATGGIKTNPIAITKVYDNYGNLIWNNEAENETKKEVVLDEGVSYLITDMLKSAIARGPEVWGTGWRAKLNRPAAGKTGTTSNYTDAWFVGFTPKLATSIWIGEDQPQEMKYPKKDDSGDIITDDDGEEIVQTISSGDAAKLWGNYMREVVKNRPIKSFSKPNSVITKEICIESGKIPNQYCPSQTQREELFLKDSAPEEECSLHKETKEVEVDTSTGKLATKYCPDDKIEKLKYQVETGFLVDKNEVPIKKTEQDKEVEEDSTEKSSNKKDPKLPLTDEEGDYIYKKVPQDPCKKHTPEEKEKKIKDRILDFFNSIND